MFTIRPLRWPDDREALRRLDTTFSTDRIYQVERQEMGFSLHETRVTPKLTKTYIDLTDELHQLPQAAFAVVADTGLGIGGLAVVQYQPWNRRAVLWHLYVQPTLRRSGMGRALLKEATEYARSVGAWCLWLETQNINYPAIQFYRKCGFHLCGLDADLYDPQGPGKGEVALFFSKAL